MGSQFMRDDEESRKAGRIAVENAIVVDLEEIHVAVVRPELKAEAKVSSTVYC
jgi:hypothetical protein